MLDHNAIGAYVYARLTNADRQYLAMRMKDVLRDGDSDGFYCAIMNMGVSLDVDHKRVTQRHVSRFCGDLVRAKEFEGCLPEDWERILRQGFGKDAVTRIDALYDEAVATQDPAKASEKIDA